MQHDCLHFHIRRTSYANVSVNAAPATFRFLCEISIISLNIIIAVVAALQSVADSVVM